MRSGKLRHRITVENPRAVKDSLAGQKPDPAVQYPEEAGWEFVGKLWAEVTDVTARERYQVGQLDSGITTTVMVRAAAPGSTGPASQITALSRFDLDGRKLYVIGPPIKDPRRRSLTLTCQERTVA